MRGELTEGFSLKWKSTTKYLSESQKPHCGDGPSAGSVFCFNLISRDRQIDNQTDRGTDKQTGKQADGQTEGQAGRQTLR